MEQKKLKRILLVFILCLSCQQGVIASKYFIYKIEGNVLQLKNGNWISPSLRDEISLSDKFNMKEGALLAIADKESNRVYCTKEVGIQNVAQIISSARRQSDEISKLAFQQALASAKGKAPKISVLGVVNRGATNTEDTTRFVHAILYNMIKEKSYVNKTSNINLSCIQDNDQWYFCVKNNYNVPLFINIIRMPLEGQKPLLCLDFTNTNETPFIMVNPKSEIHLKQYPFIKIKKSYEYILFATEYPFDSQTLRILLDSDVVPQQTSNEIEVYISSQCF